MQNSKNIVRRQKVNSSLTVSLQGGLGNQLFQYAFGRAWSLRNNTQVFFDEYGFHFDSIFKRTQSLDFFSILGGIRKNNSKNLFHIARLLKHFGFFGIWIGKRLKPKIIIEETLHFDKLLDTNHPLDNCYAFGYWQDERYFFDYAEIIRKDLQLSAQLSSSNMLLKNQIELASNSVAIHIRRLHQVAAGTEQSPHANGEAAGFVLSPKYYIESMAHIEKVTSNPNYFIFSDYPGWAQENLIFNYPAKILEVGRGEDYEDLFLMSLCEHHIIANSSFSWWGAWLGETKRQIVCAPDGAQLTPQIPARWIKILSQPTASN